MQMMSPARYKENNKDKSLEELLLLEKELKSKIDSLSQNQNKESIFISDTRLQIIQEYYDKIQELIKEKRMSE